ncbi:MAG: hypothetical protein NT027_01225, partial [Proteobacteria bacterium]|nr:hypothetical protein [Pseudomonadota bacterium]
LVLNMTFFGGNLITVSNLFTLDVKGLEFFLDSTPIEDGALAKTEFTVVSMAIDTHLVYPTSPQGFCREGCEDIVITLPELKEIYFAEYGPYTVQGFTKKVNAVYAGFREAELMTNDSMLFIRKMWLFKQLYEIFEGSMGLIIIRMSKLLPNIYAKANKVLSDAETKKNVYSSAREKKYADIAIEAIRRVQEKIVEAIGSDVKFLKLLSPELLAHFVGNARPHMKSIAKIKCLPWIEPEIALMAAPGYNIYWSEFWFPFLARNFKLSSDLCQIIADFMPIALQGETFLDYFRRKYNARSGFFMGSRSFGIDTKCVKKDGEYTRKILITLN